MLEAVVVSTLQTSPKYSFVFLEPFCCIEPVSALPTPPTAGSGFADGATYAISGLDESLKVNNDVD